MQPMSRFSAVLAFALALVVALTSQTTAQMRGQSMAVGAVVLCLGGSAVTVAVDENGNPTGPAHICPDCMAAQFTAPVPGLVLPSRPAARPLARTAPPVIPAAIPAVLRVHAPVRAPPAPV